MILRLESSKVQGFYVIRRDKIRRADAQPQLIRSTLGVVFEPVFLLIPLGMQVRQDENASV